MYLYAQEKKISNVFLSCLLKYSDAVRYIEEERMHVQRLRNYSCLAFCEMGKYNLKNKSTSILLFLKIYFTWREGQNLSLH